MQENNQTTTNNSENDSSKLMAVLAYFVFFLPLFTEKKNDPDIKFHVRQSLGIVISLIVVSILGEVLPVIGPLLIEPFGKLTIFVLWIFGLINAFKGEQKVIPLIGKLADEKLKF